MSVLERAAEFLEDKTQALSGRQFAYGNPEVDGVCDPPTQAGIDPDKEYEEGNPWYSRVAEQYDTNVRMKLWEQQGNDYDEVPDNPDRWLINNTDLNEGVIDEELARECWLMAAECQESMNKGVSEGTEVARELGWLEE